MESKLLSRKEFLTNSAKYAAGITAGMGALGLLTRNKAGARVKNAEWPWPYVELDPEEARIRGHAGYWTGRGCSYGAFHPIVSMLADEIGEPYTLIPTEFLEWGKGGAWGWGTLCGGLIGALTAMNLCWDRQKANKLGNELIGWYTMVEFPSDIGNQYATEHKFTDNRCDIVLPQTVAGSPLCHVSVTNWCTQIKYQYKRTSTERSERCARLTGDVAAYAVQIMNDELKNQFQPLYQHAESVKYCMDCHGPSGPIVQLDNTIGNMDCVQCHTDHTGTFTSAQKVEEFSPTYKLHQNYPNPFNPSTTIRFSLPAAETVTLAVYDIHGRLVKNIVAYEQYQAGSFEVAWDGRNNAGQVVASGTYFVRLYAGPHVESMKLTFVK
jgi:hypothetical protein